MGKSVFSTENRARETRSNFGDSKRNHFLCKIGELGTNKAIASFTSTSCEKRRGGKGEGGEMGDDEIEDEGNDPAPPCSITTIIITTKLTITLLQLLLFIHGITIS